MTSPPAGIMTFVFTDIEGSTKLWQQHPETMPDVLARHDALAREAIESRGGHVFKHTGDGVCAAFSDATAALEAAIALQHALAKAAWERGLRPLVRVGVDSGPAQPRDGDYFGQTLNRTARVLAAGAGAQIVATAATMTLATGIETIDLGLHRLRDLGEPVRLHQVVADGLERTFPPLRTLDRFRHSLPVLRSSFVGRDAELGRLRELLAPNRLLTVTGVGGCGKTRLALALASQEIERFPDGAFFVDLAAVTEPGLVWGEVAGSLGGVAPAGGVSPRDAVLGRLTDTRSLVLLDNCEHVLDACAEVAAAILARPGAVALLATSREPVGVEGEQVFRVPSLAVPDDVADAARAEAVRLFVERATAADASFVLTPTVAPVVVEICRRLDGIPLAIELAAARVRHLSPPDIARRLDDRFRLLTGGPRGARQRQQTLAAALDWSHQLLADRERILLRRCAVFVDGFSLAAAEGVCAGDGIERDEVVDVLGALVDKSLIALHAAEHRYRLLETIRLYAEERLIDAGEADTVRTRHATWFQAAYDTSQPGTASAEHGLGYGMPAVPADAGNLRAARAWAHEMRDGVGVARLTVALFRQNTAWDPAWREQRDWCATALAYDLPPVVRAETLATASFLDITAGDWSAAVEHGREALAVAPDAAESFAASAYIPLAIGLMVRDPDAADRVIDEGVERIRRARAPLVQPAAIASFRVSTALMRGDPARAADLARTTESTVALRPLMLGFPFALHLLGDHDGAEREARRPRDAFMSTGGEHAPHLLLALTATATGRPDYARRELETAVAIARRYRHPLTLNDCVIVCGAVAAMQGRLERASVLLAAIADQHAVRSPELWAVYLHYRGRVRAALDAATVRRCREEARSLDLERAVDEELSLPALP